MNHSEEVNILKHQRIILTDGILNYKNMFLGTIETTKDANNNVSFNYGKDNNGQICNNRMTPCVYYFLHKISNKNNIGNRLDYLYIARLNTHLNHLSKLKEK
jgi:hypothetical protein